MQRLRQAVRQLFRREPRTVPAAPAPPAAPQAAAETVRRRVLMIVHDPPVESEGGRRLTQIFGWHDPDDLARRYIRDLFEASGGYVGYEIVERIAADWYPVKVDGFRYTGESLVQAWRTRTMHEPNAIDYPAQVAAFDLIGRYDRGEMEEVWFFSFPYAGDYESTMVGRGAFWLNSPPVPNTGHASGRFPIMAFNYERDVDCMLENYCHRVESIMGRVYERMARGPNMWELFTLYDRVAPGRAQCGNVHFAPNSERDYDWGNPRPVLCFCDDWYAYPDLAGRARVVTAAEWGGGDMRAHHLWWLGHLPRRPGETGGVANNWWRYVVDVNLVE
ncbi:MAG: hypothetical protein QME94_00915 [Anaerolineae bacterium]|nr:hypothetical protein [Anaerolineae bacterium]